MIELLAIILLNVLKRISIYFCSSLASAVTIVVDGGDATISNIYHDLRANIPVVMIKVRLWNCITANDILIIIGQWSCC